MSVDTGNAYCKKDEERKGIENSITGKSRCVNANYSWPWYKRDDGKNQSCNIKVHKKLLPFENKESFVPSRCYMFF